MSFGVLGSRLPGLRILDPGCVAKTYPNYWRDWQRAAIVPRAELNPRQPAFLITSPHASARYRSRSPAAVFPAGRGGGVRARAPLGPRPPRAPRLDYFTGLDHLVNDRYDRATEVFTRLATKSHEADIQFALGSLMRKRGEVDRAIAIHSELAGNRELAIREQATYALGLDYMSAGLLDRAEEKLRDLMGSPRYRAAVLERLAWVLRAATRLARGAGYLARIAAGAAARTRRRGRALLLRAGRGGAGSRRISTPLAPSWPRPACTPAGAARGQNAGGADRGRDGRGRQDAGAVHRGAERLAQHPGRLPATRRMRR